MRKRLQSLFFLTGCLVFTNASAAGAIDTTAVTRLIELKQSSEVFSAAELEDNYLAVDAGGLALLRGRFQNAENLQDFYASLNDAQWAGFAECAELLSALNTEFSALKRALSELTDLPLHDVKAYGVIGGGNTAATASPTGIVLGLEMICPANGPEANTRLTLKNYLAHELVHVVQYRLTKRTDFRFNLLEIALLEGSADYVADMLLGTDYILDDVRSEYGVLEGNRLLASFKTTMLSNNYAPWLYTPSDTMPMDMGYWIGFQLADAYVANGGKLAELLALCDAQAIYDKANL